MTKTEQAAVKGLIKRLRLSTQSTFSEGYVDDWANYAKEMRAVIKTSCDVLEELANLEPENESEDIKLSL